MHRPGWHELVAFLRPQNIPSDLSESAYMQFFATKHDILLAIQNLSKSAYIATKLDLRFGEDPEVSQLLPPWSSIELINIIWNMDVLTWNTSNLCHFAYEWLVKWKGWKTIKADNYIPVHLQVSSSSHIFSFDNFVEWNKWKSDLPTAPQRGCL